MCGRDTEREQSVGQSLIKCSSNYTRSPLPPEPLILRREEAFLFRFPIRIDGRRGAEREEERDREIDGDCHRKGRRTSKTERHLALLVQEPFFEYSKRDCSSALVMDDLQAALQLKGRTTPVAGRGRTTTAAAAVTGTTSTTTTTTAAVSQPGARAQGTLSEGHCARLCFYQATYSRMQAISVRVLAPFFMRK